MKVKYRIVILVITTILIIIFSASYFKSLNDYKDTVSQITISNVDISQIPDGEYVGDCDVDFIYAKVSVAVKDGKITNIDLLKHKNGTGEPAEKITEDIISQQTIDVDIITGATNSSKVIKKAVENALLNYNN